eukprot:364104-Chlamydomonas_euryale.AAC.6
MAASPRAAAGFRLRNAAPAAAPFNTHLLPLLLLPLVLVLVLPLAAAAVARAEVSGLPHLHRDGDAGGLRKLHQSGACESMPTAALQPVCQDMLLS